MTLQLTYIHFKNATQQNLVIDFHIQQLLRTLPTALRPASQHQTALTTTPSPYSTLTNRKTRKKCTHLSRNTPNSDFTRKSKGVNSCNGPMLNSPWGEFYNGEFYSRRCCSMFYVDRVGGNSLYVIYRVTSPWQSVSAPCWHAKNPLGSDLGVVFSFNNVDDKLRHESK